MATQTLIWEAVVGERDSNFNHVDTGSYDEVTDRVSKNHPLYSQYISYCNSTASNMQKHSKVPSIFAKSTSKAQIILGHSSINTTRSYTSTIGNEHRQRVEKMRLIIKKVAKYCGNNIICIMY